MLDSTYQHVYNEKMGEGGWRMPMTSREIIKLLEAKGFRFKGANGSHHKYEKNGQTVIVPVHNGTLKKGTEQNILKQAGLK